MQGFNRTVLIKPISPELSCAAMIRGVYSEVARKLGVTPQHVRLVGVGRRTSRRVSKAIMREIRLRAQRMERAA